MKFIAARADVALFKGPPQGLPALAAVRDGINFIPVYCLIRHALDLQTNSPSCVNAHYIKISKKLFCELIHMFSIINNEQESEQKEYKRVINCFYL